MPDYLTCDVPLLNEKLFAPGNLTNCNGGVSSTSSFLVEARARIYAAVPPAGTDPPGDSVPLQVDDMTGQSWQLSSNDTIPGLQEGQNYLILWGRDQNMAGWQPFLSVPLTGQKNPFGAPAPGGPEGPPGGPPGGHPGPPAGGGGPGPHAMVAGARRGGGHAPPMPAPAPAAAGAAAAAPAGNYKIRVKRNTLSTSTAVPDVPQLLNAGALQAEPFTVKRLRQFFIWSFIRSTAIPEDPTSESNWLLFFPDPTNLTQAIISLTQRVHTVEKTYYWYCLAFDPAAESEFTPYPMAPDIRQNLLVFPA